MIEKHHMHKSKRAIKDITEINDVLSNGRYTTLALCKDNHPYSVTLSYGFDKEKNCLYMHAANKGLKLDIIKNNSNVCGSVIEDHGYVQKECSHKYISCVFDGVISIVKDLEEKKHGMSIMLNHLEDDPSYAKKHFLQKDKAYNSFCILKIEIHSILGKKSL